MTVRAVSMAKREPTHFQVVRESEVPRLASGRADIVLQAEWRAECLAQSMTQRHIFAVG